MNNVNLNDKMVIDKQNGDICFNEEHHKYFNLKNPDVKYTSVTTLIHKFQQPFDEEFHSGRKALERIDEQYPLYKRELMKKSSIPQHLKDLDGFEEARQQVLKEWNEEKEKSCVRGTAFHLSKELPWYDKELHTVDGHKGIFHCKKHDFDLDKDKAVYPEFLIYYHSPNGILNVAGQVDLLIKDGNTIVIRDFKTNKEIKKTSFFNQTTKKPQMMLYPLNDLQDCNYNHYSMQLSTYAWMLKRINPDFVIDKLVIEHYDHSDKLTIYELEYMEKRVEKMLKFYGKQLMLEQSKAQLVKQFTP